MTPAEKVKRTKAKAKRQCNILARLALANYLYKARFKSEAKTEQKKN